MTYGKKYGTLVDLETTYVKFEGERSRPRQGLIYLTLLSDTDTHRRIQDDCSTWTTTVDRKSNAPLFGVRYYALALGGILE